MTYSVFGTNVPRDPYPTPRTGRVPGSPYSVKRVPGLPYRPSMSGADGLGNVGGSAAPMIIGGVLIAGVIGLGIYMSIRQSNAEAAVRAELVRKEGAAGLAKYEEAKLKRSAGEKGLNLLSSWLSPPVRRNPKKRRRTSRH
jgi:hypothetical protein